MLYDEVSRRASWEIEWTSMELERLGEMVLCISPANGVKAPC